jgi:hypothetical protein
LKYKAKQAVKYVTDYEEAIIQMARKQNVHGVICGHVHRAEIRPADGVVYMNCGDWVESCTALVEDFDGKIRLLHFHENNAKHTRRGTRAHDSGDSGQGDGGEGGAPGDWSGSRLGVAPAGRPILCVGDEDADYEDINA